MFAHPETEFVRRLGRMTLHLAVLGLLLLFAPSITHAQISPDRPGFGDGSTLMNASRFQVETGYGFGMQEDRSTHSLGQLLLRYGLTDWLEARGGVGSYVVNETSVANGYSGTTLGAKASLVQGGPVSMGLIATTGLPTGTGMYDSDEVWQDVTLAFGVPIAGPLSFASNVGHQFTYSEGVKGETSITTTLLLSATERIGIGFGYAGFYSETLNRNFLEGGVTYRTARNTQLDVNWAYQIDGYASQLLLGLGIAHRF